jgi:ubiquinone/menaquinone biosynthesis C-methylase UbiE
MDKLKQRHIKHWKGELQNRRGFIYEGNIFHDYFRKIPFVKLKCILDKNYINLTKKTILIAGCGNGIDIHYLKKFYNPKIYVSDIANNAVLGTIASFENIQGTVGDTEGLPFNDNTFDYSFIAHSLHHLSKPMLGLYDLLRVSKSGVIVIEPNDSILTRIATSLSLAHEIEEVGNYVYRFSKRDVVKTTRALFYDCSVIRLFAIHKVAKTKFGFFILKFFNSFANILCPFWGNYIIFIIKKSSK